MNPPCPHCGSEMEKKDIIEIVKEVQESTDHCDIVEEQIIEHFPSIAQALLIAVEALEHCSFHSCGCGQISGEALHKIRSLPSQ